MDLFGSGRSTATIFLFIIFPLGIVAEVVDQPKWDEGAWKRELESFRRKYHPIFKGRNGVNRPIPELVECALNAPKKFPPCSDTIRTALLNEILLRKQFRSFNEDCNSTGTREGEVVANPPDSEVIYELNYRSYLIWQEKLINSKLQFCDPHDFLRCSSGGKCTCLPGTVRDPEEDVCVYSHASPCTGYYVKSKFSISVRDPTGTLQNYFDPFIERSESGRYEEVLTPRCIKYHDQCIGDFRILYHRATSYCVDRGIFFEGNPRYKVHDYFEKLLPLSFNEECNFQDHNRLFTSTKEEDANPDLRFKALQDFQIREVKFCDLEKFLTCGPSGKCECMSPSSRKDNKCVLPRRLDKCIIDAEMEPILMNKSLVPRAREKLMIGFANSTVNACDGNRTCHSDMMEVYCTCPPGTTGQECNETLTKFLPIVCVPSLPIDITGYPEKIKIFSHFNKVAVEFEKIFRREESAFCVGQIQTEAEILVGGIRKLKYRGTSIMKREYEDLSKRIRNFRIPHTQRIICNETLRCQYSTKSCVNLTRRNYLQDLVKTLEKFKTRKCAKPDCSKFPKDFNDVMFGGNETVFYGGEHEMEYFRIIEELSKLLKKCDCRNKRVDNLSMSQSMNHFILLMSVAMAFFSKLLK